MKFWHHHHNPRKFESFDIYLNGRHVMSVITREMATISIDVEDNEAELITLVGNFQSAYSALQSATLSTLGSTIADLQAASDALVAFKIQFTASVANAAPASGDVPVV